MVFVTRKCGASYITSDSAARTHGWSGDVRDGCEVGAGSRHQNGLRPKFRGVPPKRLRRFRWQDKGSFELRFDLNRPHSPTLSDLLAITMGAITFREFERWSGKAA